MSRSTGASERCVAENHDLNFVFSSRAPLLKLMKQEGVREQLGPGGGGTVKGKQHLPLERRVDKAPPPFPSCPLSLVHTHTLFVEPSRLG